MKQRQITTARIILCLFCIVMIGVVFPKQTKEIAIANDGISTVDTYVYAGVSQSLNNILESIEIPESSIEKNADSIMVSEPNPIEPVVEEVPEILINEIPVDRIEYVHVDALNLRVDPNTDAEVLDTLGYGSKLQVIGESNIYSGGELIDYWTHVTYNGQTGYVKSDYLVDDAPYINLGLYDITYYCPCAKCCGVQTGITASGARVQAGVTIAADPSIPFGTELVIDGHTYIVQDRGGAIKGNHVDIYCDTHEEALQKARHYAEVLMKVANE